MSLIENAMRQRTRPRSPAPRVRAPSPPIGEPGAAELDEVQRVEPNVEWQLNNRLICDAMEPSAIGAYKMLRTQIAHGLQAKKWSSIGVTATRAGEGKTLTAINLALSLVKNPNQKVFLVDFDLRKHTMASYLQIGEQNGLLDVLNGAPLEKGLIQYGNQALYLLTNSTRVENSSELLAGHQVARIVDELRRLGGITIYDLPPLLAADDFLAFSGNADCTLMVVSEGETQRDDLIRARELLSNTNLVGVVLNKSNEKALLDTYYY